MQLLLAPVMKVKLQILGEFAIAKSVNNFAQIFASDPRVAKDVHPNSGWNPKQCGLHAILLIIINLNLNF